jgi:hypothetical protein
VGGGGGERRRRKGKYIKEDRKIADKIEKTECS